MGACLISSVENGVVICSFSKDYELSSWNEQGEILQKEGMLTVCFSYIALCSHIDRKEAIGLSQCGRFGVVREVG